jgi:hypothetical protein
VGPDAIVSGPGDWQLWDVVSSRRWPVREIGWMSSLTHASVLVDALGIEDAIGGGGNLALVRHDSSMRLFDRLLELNVLEDQPGRFAIGLGRHRLQRFVGHHHDSPGRRCGFFKPILFTRAGAASGRL